MNKHQKGGLVSVITFLIQILLAIVAFSYAMEIQDQSTYSDEAQVKYILHIFLAIVFAVSSVLSIIGAVESFKKAEKEAENKKGASNNEEIIICPNCNNKLTADTKFCGFCGNKVAYNIPVNAHSADNKHQDPKSIEINEDNMTKCLFCGEKIAKSQMYCIYCKRRQD